MQAWASDSAVLPSTQRSSPRRPWLPTTTRAAETRAAWAPMLLAIDPSTRRVDLDGIEIHLTPTEFDLLHKLAETPHVVFGRKRLLEDVWGYKVGAGVQYDFDKQLGIRGEWERYRFDALGTKSNADMYSVGLNYRF